MAKTPEIWQDIEEQAFHAYREWSLWLVLRVRELQTHNFKKEQTTNSTNITSTTHSDKQKK